MYDNRAFTRHQVRIDGKLLSPDMSFCVDCTVNDISEGGAQVSVRASAEVPARVYLWQAETGAFFECDVRWRKLHLIGLHFIDIASRTQSRALIERCKPAQPIRDSRLSHQRGRAAA